VVFWTGIALGLFYSLEIIEKSLGLGIVELSSSRRRDIHGVILGNLITAAYCLVVP
jgi:hypothetical protein